MVARYICQQFISYVLEVIIFQWDLDVSDAGIPDSIPASLHIRGH